MMHAVTRNPMAAVQRSGRAGAGSAPRVSLNWQLSWPGCDDTVARGRCDPTALQGSIIIDNPFTRGIPGGHNMINYYKIK